MKIKFKALNMPMRIVMIHILIYVLSSLWQILVSPFVIERSQHYFVLPASFSELLRHPWVLLTYSFFHADVGNLLFNSLFLVLTGRLFLFFFTRQAFLKFYFWGALGAALVYLIGMNVCGYTSEYLYGASAATMSVFFAVVAYRPNIVFPLPFVGRILLKHIAVFLLITDVLSLLDVSNAGSRFSHLGGAALGFLYMKQFEMGRDILDFSYWRARWKKTRRRFIVFSATVRNQRKVDKILEKLSHSGYESLSEKEKEFLFHIDKGKGDYSKSQL
ncbi:MAG: rhomboid family intramembrane serine protease [Flavobacteriales bacterium AspAUS03]